MTCVTCGKFVRGLFGWFCSDRCDRLELESRLAQRAVDGLRNIGRFLCPTSGK